jgi:predicted amidophosphoribosyltransferase
VCEQDLQGYSRCGNWLCNDRSRAFEAVRAVSMRTSMLKTAINRYKYDGQRGWAWIFGRVVVGYLDANADVFRNTDLVVASPTYTGTDARRSWDHTRAILERAAIESKGTWPFDLGDPPAIIKTAETQRLVDADAATREQVAREQLRPALLVPRPDRVAGRSIVVLDDVFTRGTTLNEVARTLKAAGASEVIGLVLARQPWGA